MIDEEFSLENARFYLFLFDLIYILITFAKMKGFFSSGRKSPSKEKDRKSPSKDKNPVVKEKSPVKENLVNAAVDNNNKNKNQQQAPAGFTKPYEYQESDPNLSPNKKNIRSAGFRYDEDPALRDQNRQGTEELSPNSQSRRATGLAFNYAPGENVKESADKLKHGEVSPRTREKIQRGELSPKSRDKLLKDGNLSPNMKAKLSALGDGIVGDDDRSSKYVPSKSYSPSGHDRSGAANVPAGTEGTYRPIDPTSRFIEGERYDKNQAFVPSELKTGAGVGGAAGDEVIKKIKVKIMVIVGKIDPKTKKIDPSSGQVEHSIGIMDKDSGKIETKYGLLDPKAAVIETTDSMGQKVTYKGTVDAKSGAININEGVVDKTGAVNPELGQVINIVLENQPLVEIIAITSKVDNNGVVDIVNGEVEKTRGIYDVESGIVSTKYGDINTKTAEVKVLDAKSGKYATKTAKLDANNDLITIVGVTDAKTGKVDNNQGHLISIGSEIDPLVEVVSVIGKLDKKGNLDPKTTVLENCTGQFDPETLKITTKYGQFDLIKNTVTFVDPKTGKTEVKDAKIDIPTGQVILKNQVNPKTNKVDKDFVRIISLRIVNNRVDPSSGKALPIDGANKDVRFDPKTNQIWVAGDKDKKTGEVIFTSSHVDKHGYIITIYGYLNPKTNEIEKQVKMDPNLMKIDPVSNQIYTANGDYDESTGEPLFSVTEINRDNGEVYTKVGKVDPKTGRLVIVRVYMVNRRDERGRSTEVDLKSVELDPQSGRIMNIVTNTIYVYKMVDPVTGDIVQVDPNDPRISGARTTVTQTLTLTGEIDEITGRIKVGFVVKL